MRIFRRALWDERIALLWWALVLVAFTLFAISTYEQFGFDPNFMAMMDRLPPYMKTLFGGLDWTTIQGYLNTEIFSWLPLLIAFYAGLYAASSLSREVDSHTAEILLAQPVRRWSVVLAKFGAMACGALLLNLVLYAVVVFLVPVLAKGQVVQSWPTFLVVLAGFLTSLAAGSLALLISALVNDQRRATAFASAIIMLLYFVNVIGQISSKAKFLTKINPFGRYHSAEIIKSGGIAGADALFLGAFILLFLGAAVWWFERKDIA
jgi:ABC-2 type transport system permease protein